MVASIEFKLLAPNNRAAALIGSFSNWENLPMVKGEDGYFRTQVELKDGVYRYQFRVQPPSNALMSQEWVTVNDPYAVEIDRATETSVLRINQGQKIVDTYGWQYDHQLLPTNEELAIYEIQVADFARDEAEGYAGGTFKQVIEKLDYLSELGINAIELMPVNEYPGNYSWGYKVRYFFAVESSYGTTEDLKCLIDECHRRGIRVILDGIYNHSDEGSPLLSIDRNYWYYPDRHYPEDPANYWGPEFNYDQADGKRNVRPAWQFIGDVVRFWIEEYHIDGIRYDAVRQLGNSDFLSWIVEVAKAAAGDKPFYNIAEHIPEKIEWVAPQGPMDGCWHESFRIFALANLAGDNFDLGRLREILNPKQQGYCSPTNVINYLATHDRDHVMALENFYTLAYPEAIQRVKLGAALLFTAVGVPMLWMGEEFGEDTRSTPNQPSHLQWSLLKQDLNFRLWKYYQALIHLRTSNPALYTANIEFFHENPEAKVLAYQRSHPQGARVVVVANFSPQHLAGYRIFNFPTGKWREWTRHWEREVDEGELQVDLSAWEAQVFVSQLL